MIQSDSHTNLNLSCFIFTLIDVYCWVGLLDSGLYQSQFCGKVIQLSNLIRHEISSSLTFHLEELGIYNLLECKIVPIVVFSIVGRSLEPCLVV